MVVLHGLVDLGVVDILWREGLAAMCQYDAPESSIGRILYEGVDMNVALVVGHLGPLGSTLGTQIAAFATAIEVENTTTRDGRTEITVACHLHVDDVSSCDADWRAILYVCRRRVITTDINGTFFG